jgi:hypothetical protein
LKAAEVAAGLGFESLEMVAMVADEYEMIRIKKYSLLGWVGEVKEKED